MKKFFMSALFALFLVGCGASNPAQTPVAKDGSNDIMHYSLQKALNSDLAKEKLDGSIKFVFGSAKGGNVIKKGLVANKKTNNVGKDDEVSCQRALISTLITFQERAKQEGGTKVVNLISYFKKREFSSDTEFECAVGNLMSGVALKGDIVK